MFGVLNSIECRAIGKFKACYEGVSHCAPPNSANHNERGTCDETICCLISLSAAVTRWGAMLIDMLFD